MSSNRFAPLHSDARSATCRQLTERARAHTRRAHTRLDNNPRNTHQVAGSFLCSRTVHKERGVRLLREEAQRCVVLKRPDGRLAAVLDHKRQLELCLETRAIVLVLRAAGLLGDASRTRSFMHVVVCASWPGPRTNIVAFGFSLTFGSLFSK